MKSGTLTRSTERPAEGFTFTREGYEIYISYVEPKSISEVEVKDYDTNDNTIRKEYEYTLYNYYGAVDSYEELVNKTILLKYSIEKELSLIAKAIINPADPQYLAYREYVAMCKEKCNEVFISLGLIKEEI